MTDRRSTPSRQLTPEQWGDAADLLDQFATQCEIAFEDHDKDAKAWVRKRLVTLTELADERGAHPRRRKP